VYNYTPPTGEETLSHQRSESMKVKTKVKAGQYGTGE